MISIPFSMCMIDPFCRPLLVFGVLLLRGVSCMLRQLHLGINFLLHLQNSSSFHPIECTPLIKKKITLSILPLLKTLATNDNAGSNYDYDRKSKYLSITPYILFSIGKLWIIRFHIWLVVLLNQILEILNFGFKN